MAEELSRIHQKELNNTAQPKVVIPKEDPWYCERDYHKKKAKHRK